MLVVDAELVQLVLKYSVEFLAIIGANGADFELCEGDVACDVALQCGQRSQEDLDLRNFVALNWL